MRALQQHIRSYSLSDSIITIFIIRFIIHYLRILSLQYELHTILTTNNVIYLNNITRLVLEMVTCICREVESEYMRALVMTLCYSSKGRKKTFVKRIHMVLKQINHTRMQGQSLGFLYFEDGRLVNKNPSGRSCDRLTPARFLVFHLLS
jgi:hypothetical protein